MKKCVIDIGSNSIKACIYEAESFIGNADDNLTPISFKSVSAKLLSYINEGVISSEGLKVLSDSCEMLYEFAKAYGAADIHLIATEAMRNVSGADAVLKELGARLGITARLLKKEEEAMCDYLAAKHFCPLDAGIALDLGGGSGQIVIYKNNKLEYAESMPIGSLKMRLMFSSEAVPNRAEKEKIEQFVSDKLSTISIQSSFRELILMGGTGMTFKKMLEKAGEGSFGRTIKAENLYKLTQLSDTDPQKALALIAKTDESRKESYYCGLAVIGTVCKRFEIESLLILPVGVREGYLLLSEQNKHI